MTAVLRALSTEHGKQFDQDAAFIQRQQLLEQRLQQQQAGGGSAGKAGLASAVPAASRLGRSRLAQQLLGDWAAAPKAARSEFESFLTAVAGLLGGELPSEELQEAAEQVWAALEGLPTYEQLHAAGHMQARQLRPHTEALQALPCCGPGLQQTAVAKVVLQVGRLQQWQQQQQPGVGCAIAGGSSSAAFSAGAAAASLSRQLQQLQGKLLPEEYGAALDVQLPEGPAALAWFLGSSSMPQRSAAAAAGSGAVSVSTPGELRQLFAAEAAADDLGWGGAAGGAAAAAAGGDEYDVDIDSDDERKGRGKKVGLAWLDRWAAGIAGKDQGPTLCMSIASQLFAAQSTGLGPDELAAQLLDLLGDAAFEAVGQLLERRADLFDAVRLALAKLAGPDFQGTEQEGHGAMPSYAPGVTVTSSSQKLMAKLERKQQRRGQAAGGRATPGADLDAELELLQGLGWPALLEAEVGGKDTQAGSVWLGGMQFAMADADGGLATRGVLPKGTKRKTHKGYEEVTVPAAQGLPPPGPDELVPISSLEPWAQAAFPGYKTLNRIQSRIFTTAYYSNENLLVCAPTGAGKTNIAMITVLREIAANMAHGVIQRDAFKIVYVAPMKALAAEVTSNFGKRLAALGLTVKELTGDMQLSKRELAETQMIVTTPEKWDVITRKGGDVAVASLVKLLIIDEVHLLNDERGPVIETIIARTLRQVESSQRMIRIVGLSATLPNYQDVAAFLRVNAASGLFHFDASYRPVPLELSFVGVTVTNMTARTNMMNQICYDKVVDSLKRGYQVMVFVHSRKDTGKTGRVLADLAAKAGECALFESEADDPRRGLAVRDVNKSRNRELQELFQSGLGLHHAGMLRGDRNLTERLFAEGWIKVLVCTATLAWGVNLPAHTVIIKGTQVYDAKKGAFAELGMLDVQQIFGRAGRPQFDVSGEATIITAHSKLAHYLGMLTHAVPIESQFKSLLPDNLNAELVLGSVSNVKEAVAWLTYTYLHVRMTKNPLVYGISYEQLLADPTLASYGKELIINAARQLRDAKLAVFDERSGNLYVTELGRVASHFYIRYQSILVFNERLKEHMTWGDVLAMMSLSSEFENIMVREEELPELEALIRSGAIPHAPKGGVENKQGKANILIQAFISRARVDSFSLTADLMYVASNAPRIARALFEIVARRKWSAASDLLLEVCKCLELRLWPEQHPLRQVEAALTPELLWKMEERGLSMERLDDMSAGEIGAFLRHPAAGDKIRGCLDAFPHVSLEASLHPITRGVARIQLTITPQFTWRDKLHGGALRWWLRVEDPRYDRLHHAELWTLTKKMAGEGRHKLGFTIPLAEPLPGAFYLRLLSDAWLHAEETLELPLAGLQLPSRGPPHTELLDLDPLPLSALGKPAYVELYRGRFTHFNPIQTQAFHTLFHTDESVLLGAPTGSGKTISSELTMMRLWEAHPGDKVIYIAPLKALVRERMNDWGKGLCRRLGKRIVELTGDYTPDLAALLSADIIIATPEKWDGISRNWQSRGYVKKVGLLIIDEIHLLGADRGPILEVIVSRMRYIGASMGRPIRFVGLSTALANAHDLADWLGSGGPGLFNFKPSVRPVQLEAHMQGYPGKFYCPRMASMNKPAYAAIQVHSPLKPVLVFVASRRQTRLTALDLISHAAADERPTQWVHMEPGQLAGSLARVKDASLRHCLQFGVGLHHAGLAEPDRQLVEALFVAQKIQVLVATSTLAWGVNTPAHLVIVKGTEYYDAPSRRYVDFPITDVLQMMGRAGRPQYDTKGVAVVMVHEPKKAFYKRFLYEPFPVESSLQDQLADHLNAEVVAGTITSRQDALDYLTWTYFYRRLLQNPAYYDLEDATPEGVSAYLSQLVEAALTDLAEAGCVTVDELDEDADAAGNGGGAVLPTPLGRVASFYYLRHSTAGLMAEQFRGQQLDHAQVLDVLTSCSEYDELPVRHNEDVLNTQLARQVRLPVDTRRCDDPHIKAQLLLQAHLGRLPPPISDYLTDTRGVLDNSVRLAQALIDVAAQGGCLGSALAVMELLQALVQARWMDANSLTTLPHIEEAAAQQLAARAGITALPQLLHALQQQGRGSKGSSLDRAGTIKLLGSVLGTAEAEEAVKVADRMPLVDVSWRKPQQQQPARSASAAGADDDHHSRHHQQQEEVRWSLELSLLRRGGSGRQGGGGAAPRVVAPLFPKVKEEGWWLVVGHTQSLELLALKRVSFAGRATVKLSFPGCTSTGHQLHSVSLFLISDCYMGLDQQYEVVLDEAAAAAASTRGSLHTRSGWGAGSGRSGASASGLQGDGAAGMQQQQQQGQDAGAADGAGQSRRGRRQQQVAARQHHAADGGDGSDGDAGWEDEPACN